MLAKLVNSSDVSVLSVSRSCAYFDKSTRVCTVIVACPTYSTSSSNACEYPRPGIAAPSHGALEELNEGTRALMMCGTAVPKSMCVISNVPTNFGVPGALFILFTNFCVCSFCHRSSRNMSNNRREPSALIAAPAAPPALVPPALSRRADSSLYVCVARVNEAKSFASCRARSSSSFAPTSSAARASNRARSILFRIATNHASLAGEDNANNHTHVEPSYSSREP